MSQGHGELCMIISQLGEARNTLKSFIQAQAEVAEDLLKWASGQENRAIQETFAHLAELSYVWTEVQRDFSDQLKEFNSQFELILEGEKHVSQARENFTLKGQKEAKLRNKLKKAGKKVPPEEIKSMEEKLSQAERARDLAHLEVVDRVRENEAVKMIRLKEGLVKLGGSYCELAQKCLVIFTAYRGVAFEIPDVHDKDIQDIRYTGGGTSKLHVQRAKDQVRAYRRCSLSATPPVQEELPPPYTPSVDNFDKLSVSDNHNMPFSPPHGARGGGNTSYSPSYGHPGSASAPYPSSTSVNSSGAVRPIYPNVPNSASPEGQQSNSAPNLAEVHSHTSVQHKNYTSSSYSDSSYIPDMSTSVPNVRHSNLTSTPNPASAPVTNSYNPYYEWTPPIGVSPINPNVTGIRCADVTNHNVPKGKTHDASARPRTTQNHFVENAEGEDLVVSGAMKKVNIKGK
ncbi:uncharacterized protein LOC143034372 isoform X2 [Oratosquilla oratoria]